MSRRQVTVGDETITLEPFSGRKAIRVIRTIERITKGVPAILEEWARFTREYTENNVTEMDRATAHHYFRPDVLTEEVPMVGDDGNAMVATDGTPLTYSRPMLRDGEAMLGPDPLAHLTDADWVASGNKLRLPRSPSFEERVMAVFPSALDLAEDEVTQLLAVLATPNKELKRHARDGSLGDYIKERADDLLDAPATDLMELAVASGEMVDEQFSAKLKELGDRAPNVLRLLGLTRSPTSQNGTSKKQSYATNPSSSTDSPPSTDGTNEPSSTAPIGDSSPLSPTV
jgi:hypothetical protein